MEIPLPMPKSVICPPNHIKKQVQAARVINNKNIKPNPEISNTTIL